MATIAFQYSEGGISLDPVYIVLRDPTNTFGLKRNDTGEILVASGTALTRNTLGDYSYTFIEPEAGLTYTYWLEWQGVGNSTVQRLERVMRLTTTVEPLSIVQPNAPTSRSGCPVLTRLAGFTVSEGAEAVLEFTFRDAKGVPIKLIGPTQTSQSSSSSESASSNDSVTTLSSGDEIILRGREFASRRDWSHIWESFGSVTDGDNGVVQAAVSPFAVKQCGVYQLSWAVKRNNKILITREALLTVDRSLFSMTAACPDRPEGPPTLDEIRMNIWDSSPAENLLLDDVEFGAEQIMLAITKPINYFNEVPPPLNTRFDTHNFPWREHWIAGIVGHLYEMAAAFYRRNRLQGAAGGVSIDDLNKANEYMQAAKMKLDEWRAFVLAKKVELNMAACTGEIGSPFDYMPGTVF